MVFYAETQIEQIVMEDVPFYPFQMPWRQVLYEVPPDDQLYAVASSQGHILVGRNLVHMKYEALATQEKGRAYCPFVGDPFRIFKTDDHQLRIATFVLNPQSISQDLDFYLDVCAAGSAYRASLNDKRTRLSSFTPLTADGRIGEPAALCIPHSLDSLKSLQFQISIGNTLYETC